MTDLYRISIDDKTDATLRGRIHMINPDAGFFPEELDFPLRIIIDAWHRMKHGYFFTGHHLGDDRLPMPRERAAAIATENEIEEEFEECQALDEGAEVRIEPGDGAMLSAADAEGADAYEQASLRIAEKYGMQFRMRWMSNRDWYIQGERDGEAFLDRAYGIINAFEVGEPHNMPPFWDADDDFVAPKTLDGYPYVEFTLTVRDARYLAHLSRGMHWATAIYGELED
ncbi:hypothetical protein AB0H34_12305 [Saccharopolyspora shandongensis]|uniref:hypothetical protein n=1 Tax=Saccharopolyspora shandongensis TaxID=418495 RepID=UPI00340FB7EC